MNKKFIVANWKMAPATVAHAQDILDAANDALDTYQERKELSLIFCPPFVFIEEIAHILHTSHLLHEASLGAQDISTQDEGSLTGEVSGPMLRRLGVQYCIVGHSERRWKLGESDEIVNQKLKAVLRNELVPIVCLGEKVRDDGYIKFLQEQTKMTFANLIKSDVEKCIIAYEPVWAVSSGNDSRPDTPEEALEAINVIRNLLLKMYGINNVRCLYGGSVTEKNAADFLSHDGIDGILVGSASVKKDEFTKIITKAAGIV